MISGNIILLIRGSEFFDMFYFIGDIGVEFFGFIVNVV